MARGLLSGLIWGSVVAVGGAAVVSLGTPLPQAPRVVSNQPNVSEPATVGDPASVPETSSSGATVADQPSVPAAPQSDDLAALDDAATASADTPTVGEPAPLGEASAPETQTPSVATRTEAPSTPNVSVTAPEAPAVSEDLTLSTELAQPAQPQVIEEGSGFGTQRAESAPEGAEAVAETDTPQTDAPAEITADTSAETPAEAPADTPAETSTAQAQTPRVAALPRVEPETPDPASDGTADSTEADLADESEAEDTATAPSPTIGQRVAPLTERDTATASLPSVAEEPETASETPASDGAQEDLVPFERHAAPFSNPDDKPLLSIVLIDDEGSIGAEALQSFPYPLTFAVDPFDPSAAEKMARYRAAGFEVMALMDLPLDSTAQDAETALEAGLGRLDQVVGVIEGVDNGLQGSRPLSDQVTAILRDKGYGFVTQNSGLNTVQKLAAREGVPSAFVFRDFDGANQTPTVMRRFLDQAAFRAGQEGGVIMLGRVRPDTISALLLWGLQDRANRVALAPVSAILRSAEN